MSDFGRIHAFVVTNRNGSVLYERFYDQLSEIQKAEMRTALGQCSRDVARMANGQVGVGNFRCATAPLRLPAAAARSCTWHARGPGQSAQRSSGPLTPRRGATIVFQPFEALVYFCVGSGEYDELTSVHPPALRASLHPATAAVCCIFLAVKHLQGVTWTGLRRAVLTVVQSIISCLKTALKTDKQPSEAQIVSKYDKLCVVVDEVIHEARCSGTVDRPKISEKLASSRRLARALR